MAETISEARSYSDSAHRIHIFRPIGFEEILLSNKYLQKKSSSILHNDIVNYALTGKIYFGFHKNEYITVIGKVSNLEQLLYRELNKISALNINKSVISRCFTCNCCDYIIVTNGGSFNYGKVCKDYTKNDKIMQLENYSLAGGLLNIIELILGRKQTHLNSWSKVDKMRLYI